MKRAIAIIFLLAGTSTSYCDQDSVKLSSEMNGLIRSVHAELMELKKSISWLSDYNEGCFQQAEGRNFISYTPLEKETKGPQPQQSDHFSISLLDTSRNRGPKHSNIFEDTPACLFPKMHLQLYGEILVWKDRKLEARLKRMVVAECEKWQRLGLK